MHKKGPKRMRLFPITDEEARQCQDTVYRIEPGAVVGTGKLAVAARVHPPDVEFGVFEFVEFSEWLLGHYWGMVHWLDGVLEEQDIRPQDIGPAVYATYDQSYLALLTLALKYSLMDDILGGGFSPSDLIRPDAEPARRTKAMLEFHAKNLPVQLGDGEIFQTRIAVVAGVLCPIAIGGFDTPEPSVKPVLNALPKPLKLHWRTHKYSAEPLCQFMVAAFWFAFRYWSDNADRETWEGLIETFWPGWENHLLDVNLALEGESLDAKG